MSSNETADGKLRRKRILIPYFWSYYLFDYMKFLVPQLSKDGFDVVILTYQEAVVESLSGCQIEVRWVPAGLRYLIARSSRIPHRICLWLAAWCWGLVLRKQYDFVILPWDNRPVWYVLSCVMPSLTCHNTTELMDVDLTLKRDRYRGGDSRNLLLHKVLLSIDTVLGGRFLPRFSGQITKFSPKQLVIDRLMGYRAQSFLHGFSKVDYFTVSGHKIKENCRVLGIDESKVIVTGNPNYDTLSHVKNSFGTIEQERFRENLGIKKNSMLFSFFLSPSSFSKVQMTEVLQVVREIDAAIANACFVLKFHPKTRKADPIAFKSNLESLGKRLLIETVFRGDEHNAHLVLASDYVVQKQSTVGFIAMLLGKNIISYNLQDTDYEDDMYKVLDASVHVESTEELRSVLRDIRNGEFADLKGKQRDACHKFCLDTYEANKNISKVVQRHFDSQSRAVKFT